MKLTITAAVHARWGHRVDGLIHTHAWMVEATLDGPADCDKVFPADDLERILLEAVEPWRGGYLTHEDVGEWKGYEPIVWDRETHGRGDRTAALEAPRPRGAGADRSGARREHRVRSVPHSTPFSLTGSTRSGSFLAETLCFSFSVGGPGGCGGFGGSVRSDGPGGCGGFGRSVRRRYWWVWWFRGVSASAVPVD